MKSNQILDEARKYLLYVSDALSAVAKTYSTDRHDRQVLAQYAEELVSYADNLQRISNNVVTTNKEKQKQQVVAELEYVYTVRKNAAVKAKKDVEVVKSILKKAQVAGVEKDIEEAKLRVEYYIKRANVAQQNEIVAKREFEQGVTYGK